jgi:hypothetical protein
MGSRNYLGAMAVATAPANAADARTVKVLFWGVTALWADRLFAVSSTVLIIGGVLTLAGTLGTIIFSAAREHFVNERISANEAVAAVANEKAEHERLERVKIEERLAFRQLSEHQRRAVAAKLSPLSRLPNNDVVQSIAVFSSAGTYESAALADQIALSLGMAGFRLNRNRVNYGIEVAVSGVGLLTSSNQRSIETAGALASALNEAGIFAFIIPHRRTGCEEFNPPWEPAKIAATEGCSAVSVFVGDHP